MDKTIVKMVRPVAPFEMILRDTLQDSNLSLRALGALGRLISMPGDWRWELWKLEKDVLKTGRDARKKIFSELEKAGYLIRSRRKDEKGRWIHEYQLFGEAQLATSKIKKNEPPSSEKSSDGKSVDGFSGDGEGVDKTNNTKLEKTDLQKTQQQPAAVGVVSLELHQKLVDYGVAEKVAEKLVKNFDRGRIIENLEYVGKQHAAGKVGDLAAYTVQAIQNDYRPKESTLEKNAREKREADLKKAEEQKQAKAEAEKKQKNENAEKNCLALAHFDELDAGEKADLQKFFPDWLAEKNTYAFNKFRVEGIESNVVASCWVEFLKEKLVD